MNWNELEEYLEEMRNSLDPLSYDLIELNLGKNREKAISLMESYMGYDKILCIKIAFAYQHRQYATQESFREHCDRMDTETKGGSYYP